ncbi:MAG: hypothetical protein LAC70_04905 [Methylovulum sp.]|nr:hypothetical protein [Methylovulum sp.]
MGTTVPPHLADVFQQLNAADIRLRLEGERLRFDAPQGALTESLREQLTLHKADIITHLQNIDYAAQNETHYYPLSFTQQHFWTLQQLNPRDCFYTVPFAFKISGEVALDALQQSMNLIVKRHEILRTTLKEIDGVMQQMASPNTPADWQVYDLRAIPQEQREDALKKHIAAEFEVPFDLSVSSCLRVRVIQLTDTEQVLLLCLHILIYDQRSLNALLAEISVHYAANLAGKTVSLPALPLQYGDYAIDQQALLTTPMQQRSAYWQSWFTRGEPQPWTWQTHQEHRAQDFEAEILWQHFDEQLMHNLKLLAQSCGVTLYMTLLAAYSALLYRYTACPDVIIGTTFANRGRWQFESIIGSMLSVLSLRISLHDDPTWENLLQHIRDEVAHAMTHQDIPYRVVMPFVQPERTQLAPLFHSILSFLAETAHNELTLPNCQVNFMEHVANPYSRPDLYLTIWEKMGETHEGLTGYWLPQKNLFSPAERATVMQDFEALLNLMVNAPTHTVNHALTELSRS